MKKMGRKHLSWWQDIVSERQLDLTVLGVCPKVGFSNNDVESSHTVTREVDWYSCFLRLWSTLLSELTDWLIDWLTD
jgi:hypothetical protein